MKVGDWVRITKPLPEYKGLYKYKNRIGKIVIINSDKSEYRIYFKEDDDVCLFFRREITKISKGEAFLEEL